VRVLAIDPGTTESAYVIYNSEEFDCLESFGIGRNEDIRLILKSIEKGKLNVDELVIEMIASYGMPVGETTFETCLWGGRFIEVWETAKGKQWKKMYRREAKMHLCGSPRAKDANINRTLKDRFGEPGTKKVPGRMYGMKSHLWAALAIAVTFCDLKEGKVHHA